MGPLAYRDVMRLEGVSSLLLAACLARLAARMLALALVLYALARFDTPTLAGWVGFAAMAPGLLVSPLAGALPDRLGSATAIAVDTGCSAGCIFGLAMLALTGHDDGVLVLLLVAFYSLTGPLTVAGVRTLLPTLVPESMLYRANALDMASNAATEIAGPALAGALFACAGAATTLLTIAALFLAACLSLLPTIGRTPCSARGKTGSLFAAAAAGLGYVLRHRPLRALALSYALHQAAWGILLVAVPVTVARLVPPGASGDLVVGLLWAGSGLAGGAGALAAGRLGSLGRERRMLATAILATAPAIHPTCAVFGLPGLAIGLALVGLLSGPADVGLLTLRQRCTDPAWLGRVMAVSISLNVSGLPIGLALGGAFVAWSASAAFATAALACVTAATLTCWLLPEADR